MTMLKYKIREYSLITVGIFIVSSAFYFFMFPMNLVIGGVAGFSLVLSNFLSFSISAMTLVMNIILLIIGTVLIGKEFGKKTVYASIVLPAFLFLFEVLFPNMKSLTDDMFIDMLCCIFLLGIGQAMLFHSNGSSGGLDIVAKIMNKFLHMELGTALTISGAVIVLSGLMAYPVKNCIIGLIAMFLNGIIVDYFIAGFKRKIRVSVLSANHEEIKRFIVEKINRGVTVYSARGGHSAKELTELVTILDRAEYIKLVDFVRKTDDRAFITTANVNEVVGAWRKKH